MLDLTKLKKDFPATISRKVYYLFIIVHKLYSTIILKIKLRMWGVKYGKGIHAIGRVIIFKTPLSEIIIGKECTFNSSSKINFRGLNHSCILQTGSKYAKITIGNHVSMSGTSIVSNNNVVIEDNVLIGANCQIGDRDGHSKRYPTIPKPIHIKKNVWLGMNVVVMKGVTIGENTIIGANSIVVKDIPANCIAVGNPCKPIKSKLQ